LVTSTVFGKKKNLSVEQRSSINANIFFGRSNPYKNYFNENLHSKCCRNCWHHLQAG